MNLSAARNIDLNAGSSITTVDGNITLNANTSGTTTGNFVGIDLDNAVISTTGGAISLTGEGGDTGIDNVGVRIQGGSDVTSTGTGTITLDGTGGNGTNNNIGVVVLGSGTTVTSIDGNIQVTGEGNGTLTNQGVNIGIDATVESTGAAAISIMGTGGNGTDNNRGVAIFTSGLVTSSTGNIVITGIGGNGSGPFNDGIFMNGGTVSSTGSATVTLDGTAGTGMNDVKGVWILNSSVASVDGDIQITGVGGGTGNDNHGVKLSLGGLVQSTGSASIAIDGTASAAGAGSGVLLDATTLLAIQATLGGNIQIDGDGTGGAAAVQIDTEIESGSGVVTVTSTDSPDDIAFGAMGLIDSTSGDVAITAGSAGGAITMADGALVDAGSGLIDMDAGGNIGLGGLLTSGEVQVTSAAAILDNGGTHTDITANRAALRAATGIGSGNALETALSTLAATNSTSGNIEVSNNVGGLLTIGTVDSLVGVTNTAGGGSVHIANASPLTVAGSVSATGPVILTATDDAFGLNDNLTVNSGVTVQSTASSVTLNAGDDFIFGDATVAISAATTITFNLDDNASTDTAGTNFTMPAGIVAGSMAILSAPGGTFINGGDDDDTFIVTPQTNSAIHVDGNDPMMVTPGDTLIIDVNGVPDVLLTIDLTPPKASTLSFGSKEPVSWQEIETLDVMGPLNVTVEGSAGDDEIEVLRDGADLVINANGMEVFRDDYDDVLSLTVNGHGGDDSLDVIFAGGNPIPADTGVIDYDGGGNAPASPGDILSVTGGTEHATYRPDAFITGNGLVEVGTNQGGTDLGTITFTGLEPVDISGFATATLLPPGGDDVLTVASGLDFLTNTTDALRVSGSTGSPGFFIETAAFFNNAHLIIDTDATTAGDDQITIIGGTGDHNNVDLTIDTGVGINEEVNFFGDLVLDDPDSDLVVRTQQINLGDGVVQDNITCYRPPSNLDAGTGAITETGTAADHGIPRARPAGHDRHRGCLGRTKATSTWRCHQLGRYDGLRVTSASPTSIRR